MSGLYPNSETVFLRPQAAVEPYIVANCARWLVSIGDFKDFNTALLWLNNLSETKPFTYKNVLSRYFDSNDYKTTYKSPRDVNKYQTSPWGTSYGEDPHMAWSLSVKTKNNQLTTDGLITRTVDTSPALSAENIKQLKYLQQLESLVQQK